MDGLERDLLRDRIANHTKKTSTSRRRVQFGGELYGDTAQEIIKMRDKAEKEAADNRQKKAMSKWQKAEEATFHASCVIARRIERFRKETLKAIEDGDIGLAYLLILIPDQEAINKQARIDALPPLRLPSPPL